MASESPSFPKHFKTEITDQFSNQELFDFLEWYFNETNFYTPHSLTNQFFKKYNIKGQERMVMRNSISGRFRHLIRKNFTIENVSQKRYKVLGKK